MCHAANKLTPVRCASLLQLLQNMTGVARTAKSCRLRYGGMGLSQLFTAQGMFQGCDCARPTLHAGFSPQPCHACRWHNQLQPNLIKIPIRYSTGQMARLRLLFDSASGVGVPCSVRARSSH